MHFQLRYYLQENVYRCYQLCFLKWGQYEYKHAGGAQRLSKEGNVRNHCHHVLGRIGEAG